MAGQAFRKALLLFDRVLLERGLAETVGHPKVGGYASRKSPGKVLQATVLWDQSQKGECGEIQAVSMKAGDKVLLPEHRGTKVVLDNKD